jgi:hypothetical protein
MRHTIATLAFLVGCGSTATNPPVLCGYSLTAPVNASATAASRANCQSPSGYGWGAWVAEDGPWVNVLGVDAPYGTHAGDAGNIGAWIHWTDDAGMHYCEAWSGTITRDGTGSRWGYDVDLTCSDGLLLRGRLYGDDDAFPPVTF